MYTRHAPAMLGQDATTTDTTAYTDPTGSTSYFGPSDTSSTDTSTTTTDTTTAPAATPPASTASSGGFFTSLFSGIAQVAGAAAPIVAATSGASPLSTAQQIQFAALNAQRLAQGLTPLSAQQYLQTAQPTIGQRFTSAVKSAPSSTLLLGGLAAVALIAIIAKR